jgi:hypothetical protein
MANISLKLYTNGFIGSVLKSPTQMGSLSINNSVTNISRLGTFNINKFASLRNSFSNCRTCSLRFDINEKIIIEAFASLRYHCHYCPTFHYFLRSLWLQRLVLLLKVSTPQGLSCIWTCLHYRGLCCSWRCLHHRGLSCIWTCLHNRGLCCSWRCLHHRGQAASERVCTTDTCLHSVENVRSLRK